MKQIRNLLLNSGNNELFSVSKRIKEAAVRFEQHGRYFYGCDGCIEHPRNSNCIFEVTDNMTRRIANSSLRTIMLPVLCIRCRIPAAPSF